MAGTNNVGYNHQDSPSAVRNNADDVLEVQHAVPATKPGGPMDSIVLVAEVRKGSII
jgi:hypothetical protein